MRLQGQWQRRCSPPSEPWSPLAGKRRKWRGQYNYDVCVLHANMYVGLVTCFGEGEEEEVERSEYEVCVPHAYMFVNRPGYVCSSVV